MVLWCVELVDRNIFEFKIKSFLTDTLEQTEKKKSNSRTQTEIKSINTQNNSNYERISYLILQQSALLIALKSQM